MKSINIFESGKGIDFSKEAIISKLGKCEREIYNVLLNDPYGEFSKENLAVNTESGYEPSGGSFNNAISKLKNLGVLNKNGDVIKFNEDLLEI